MTSEFLARVSAEDPVLAEELATRIEQLRDMDRALVEAADAELAELRQHRPSFSPVVRESNSIEELFDVRTLPDPEFVKDLMRNGRLVWEIVDRLDRRHHG
jgi:hypothetical protein